MACKDVPFPAYPSPNPSFVSVRAWAQRRLSSADFSPRFCRIWAAGGADQPENVIDFAGGPISWNSSEYMQKGHYASYGEIDQKFLVDQYLRSWPLTSSSTHSLFGQGGLPSS